jgi:hypothetical protein
MATATASKDAFFNAIVDERAFELCGEMVRKGDLIRWNLLSSKLAEAKQKMYQLANKEGAYADLPDKIYYTYASDGETLVIYGLNHGDTDEAGKAIANATTKAWFVSSGANTLTNDKIESLYLRNPDERQFWPIWQNFLDSSNGMLTNDYGY